MDEKITRTKLSPLDWFSLITGVLGLLADTIAIWAFAASLGLLMFPTGGNKPEDATDGTLLLTAILGFYCLTLIVWFLIRFERA